MQRVSWKRFSALSRLQRERQEGPWVVPLDGLEGVQALPRVREEEVWCVQWPRLDLALYRSSHAFGNADRLVLPTDKLRVSDVRRRSFWDRFFA
jgi:hypothetical protein